jgi:prepilin-type N-terminal cleavage/methylation domain-containing protein
LNPSKFIANSGDQEARLKARTRSDPVSPSHRGVTLIELLCAIAIVAVLAGLLLGPVGRAMKRARAMQWGEFANREFGEVVQQMRKTFGGRTDYPRVTLPDLEALGLFNQAQMTFLHDSRVSFLPFAASDPEGQAVIQARIDGGFLTSAGTLIASKHDVTQPLP